MPEPQTLFVPSWGDLRHFLPETVLFATFLAALLVDVAVRGRRPGAAFGVTLAGCLTALALAVADQPGAPVAVLGKLLVVDGMTAFFRILFALVAVVVVLFSWSSEEIMGRRREHKGEYYALVALLTGGMCVMAGARDIVMMFLSMELVGITSYVMAGYMRTSLRSTEAAVKYVIFGAVSTAIMLYGLSLLYGLTGAATFEGIRAALLAQEAQPGGVDRFALLVVTILIVAGLAYKIAAVPFHFWCPDVYEGAPTPIAALFSVGPKAAGFALMIRFFYTTLTVPAAAGGAAAAAASDGAAAPATGGVLGGLDWPLLVAALSVATMTYGNLVALRQSNVKRLLAYSSIAHVGYVLMGFLLLTPAGLQAILFYLLVYAVMNLGAFLFVVAVNNRLQSEELPDYAGLGFRAPWAAVMMTIFLFSLTGLPPTAGFIGKMYLFAEVINRHYFWLAVVGVVNSVVSLFYYMKIAKAMWFASAEANARPALRLAPAHLAIMALLAAPTIVLGLWWSDFKDLADRAIAGFAGM